MPSTPTIHHLKVSLDGITPPIWRQVAVPTMSTLADLHVILYLAFGWTGDHLHEFHAPFAARWGGDHRGEGPVADTIHLAEIAGDVGARFHYVYNLGNYWEHTIEVEKIIRPAPGLVYPRCMGGARAAPPEWCGSRSEYTDWLWRHPAEGRRRWRAAWRGVDLEAFDRVAVNQQLAAWQVAGPATTSTEPPLRAEHYQLYVELLDIAPPIWRRLVVPGDLTLARLHRIFEAVFVCGDNEIHRFVAGPLEYGPPGQGLRSDRAVRLPQVAPAVGTSFAWWHERAAWWEHRVRVEAITPVERAERPRCLAGQRAAPPWSCTGPDDYQVLVTAGHKPRLRRRRDNEEWIHNWDRWDFNPDACDLPAINAALGKMR